MAKQHSHHRHQGPAARARKRLTRRQILRMPPKIQRHRRPPHKRLTRPLKRKRSRRVRRGGAGAGEAGVDAEELAAHHMPDLIQGHLPMFTPSPTSASTTPSASSKQKQNGAAAKEPAAASAPAVAAAIDSAAALVPDPPSAPVPNEEQAPAVAAASKQDPAQGNPSHPRGRPCCAVAIECICVRRYSGRTRGRFRGLLSGSIRPRSEWGRSIAQSLCGGRLQGEHTALPIFVPPPPCRRGLSCCQGG